MIQEGLEEYSKKMITKEQKQTIEKIIYRLHIEVVKTMKKLPKEQLFFSWKEKEWGKS